MVTGEPCADHAPSEERLTDYDRRHFTVYARLLDAEREDADWREIARLVLGIDPDADLVRAYDSWTSHLARAKWMTTSGYKLLLREA